MHQTDGLLIEFETILFNYEDYCRVPAASPAGGPEPTDDELNEAVRSCACTIMCWANNAPCEPTRIHSASVSIAARRSRSTSCAADNPHARHSRAAISPSGVPSGATASS